MSNYNRCNLYKFFTINLSDIVPLRKKKPVTTFEAISKSTLLGYVVMGRQYSFEKLSDDVKEGAAQGVCKPFCIAVIDLTMQIKESHWTLVGREFLSVHRLLDEVAEAMEDTVDDYAERIAQLGHKPRGTIQVVAAKTTLAVYPEQCCLYRCPCRVGCSPSG